MEDFILCAFTDQRIEFCTCGRHPAQPGVALHSTTPRQRRGDRTLGVVAYDDGEWTIHRLECHHFTEPHSGRGLHRLTVDFEAPPPHEVRHEGRTKRRIHICMACNPASEADLRNWLLHRPQTE